MKAKVVRTFQDRTTGAINSAGATIELTEERTKELAERGFVEVIKTPAKKTGRKTAPKEED